MANKKELANIVWRLFANIDEANQSLDMMELFQHLDNAYLIHLIGDLKETVEQNIKWDKFLCDDKETLKETLDKARKILKIKDDESEV